MNPCSRFTTTVADLDVFVRVLIVTKSLHEVVPLRSLVLGATLLLLGFAAWQPAIRDRGGNRVPRPTPAGGVRDTAGAAQRRRPWEAQGNTVSLVARPIRRTALGARPPGDGGVRLALGGRAYRPSTPRLAGARLPWRPAPLVRRCEPAPFSSFSRPPPALASQA